MYHFLDFHRKKHPQDRRLHSVKVEAEYQRNFEKETRAMVMKGAKKKAETNGQVEACLRHRVTLRNELCRRFLGG